MGQYADNLRKSAADKYIHDEPVSEHGRAADIRNIVHEVDHSKPLTKEEQESVIESGGRLVMRSSPSDLASPEKLAEVFGLDLAKDGADRSIEFAVIADEIEDIVFRSPNRKLDLIKLLKERFGK